MLEEVYKWIQNIAVYLVVVTAMLHAVPGKDYERYIRFFSGLVLIVLIFMPVLSVFGMKETFGAIYSNQVYEKERKELEEAGNSYEEMLKNYIEENKEEEHTGTKKLLLIGKFIVNYNLTYILCNGFFFVCTLFILCAPLLDASCLFVPRPCVSFLPRFHSIHRDSILGSNVFILHSGHVIGFCQYVVFFFIHTLPPSFFRYSHSLSHF